MLIAIEGLDGVGKSSVCEDLAQSYQYVNIAQEIDNMKKHIAQMPEHSGSVARLLNLSILQHMSDTAREHINNGKTVVMDRYIPSHKHYAHAFNEQAIKDGQYPDIDPSKLSLLKPDIIVLLTVNETTRKKRLDDRGTTNATENTLAKNKNIRAVILERMKKDADIVIDTSNLSVQEISTQIQKAVKQYRAGKRSNPQPPKRK